MDYFRNIVLSLLGIVSLSAIFFISTPASSPSIGFNDQNFKYAMNIVMQHEGGYSTDKNDPGGATKYGISLRFIKDEHIDVNGDGKEDVNDIIHLSQTEADQIYFQDWWKKFHYYLFKDKVIAAKVMDFSVNAGSCRAHKVLQKAINSLTVDKVPVSCKLTDEMIQSANKLVPQVLHDELKYQEQMFYRTIVLNNVRLHVFLSGWLKRAEW